MSPSSPAPQPPAPPPSAQPPSTVTAPPSASLRAPPKPTVVIVTGLSGAGRSTALNALEDLGFFCVDNLPTALATQAIACCDDGGMRRVALGIDVRGRGFLSSAGEMLASLELRGERDVHVIFLDAADEVLVRRFSESRRPHPLDTHPAHDAMRTGAFALLDEVRIERERLAPLRARASRVIDTSTLSVHELRRTIFAMFGPAGGGPRMLTRVVSFGFKFGVPADADMVFDVRFLRNPHFVPALKPYSGLDPTVADYVFEAPEASEFVRKVNALLEFTIPRYEREGKSYLTIAFGCTGGRHRSVAVTEAVARDLSAALGRNGSTAEILTVHRDMDRHTAALSTPRLDVP